MDLNAKIKRARMLMDRAHRLHAQMGETLADLCEIGTDIVNNHGPEAGVSGEVIALATEPKEP